jgi:high-affinity nickel-transport protein
MDTPLLAALGLGFLLGLRHAVDADHVAAVSTLVSQHRTLTRSCLLGTCWGLGHALALLAAGAATIVLRLSISPQIEQSLEKGVGCMLILLGGQALLRSLAAWGMPAGSRAHEAHGVPCRDGARHHHAHLVRVGRRPFVVGLAHGMAGSAALMVLVAAAMPSPIGGFLYIIVFGVGSTMGMLLLSGLIGLPFVLTTDRAPRALACIQVLAGLASSGLGLTLLCAPSSVV